MTEYRELNASEITEDIFAGFIRRQEVTKCRRRVNGEWAVVNDPFIDDWTHEDHLRLARSLRETLRGGGFVYGAFSRGVLKGFVTVEPEPFGGQGEYLDLGHLHVSLDMRRKGIGLRLFEAACAWARERGAKKLYISAHSALESQSFYQKAGCVEAAEYNAAHVEKEPCDCQLERLL